jgi:cysteinyl-tRNA synthetase
MPDKAKRFYGKVVALKKKFLEAMDNDFNTPDALAALFDLTRETNRFLAERSANGKLLDEVLDTLLELGGILGILQRPAEREELPEEVMKLIKERERARKARDWERADEIRGRLRKMGIVLEDTPQGVRWRRLKNRC